MAALYNALAGRIPAITHRDDLTAQMQSFIDAGNERINMRLGLDNPTPNSVDPDSAVLTDYFNMFLYASIIAAYEFINELDMALYYTQLFNGEIDKYFITSVEAVPVEPLYMGMPPPA